MTEEYDQYRTEQAESWLVRVRKTVRFAAQIEDAAREQYAAADGLKAIDYSRVRVSTSPEPDAIERAVIAHVEAGDALESVAESAAERVAQAARSLALMRDPTEARCLMLYYVSGVDTWERVCVEMNYSYDGIMKLRRRALLHAYDVMPHSERDPMVQAT